MLFSMETPFFLLPFFFFRGTISDNLDLLCLFLQFVTDLLFLESVMFVLGVVWRN